MGPMLSIFRPGRAWVFIISVVCFLYGMGLTLQQLAGGPEVKRLRDFFSQPELRKHQINNNQKYGVFLD